VWGLKLNVLQLQGLGFRVEGTVVKFKVEGSGFRVEELGFQVCGVQGRGAHLDEVLAQHFFFRVACLTVSGLGFRVQGLGCKV
jgi:hypothetical protein